MFGIVDYGAFVVAIIVFLLIPGPGNLALITSTGKGGIKGGLAATLGVIFGDQVLMWLAVAGVAALLGASPTAFHAVQWLGAAYLAWLGGKMLLAKPGAAPILHIKPHHYLRQALMITLLNPKAIVFYMAFFPLFVDPARHQGLTTFAFMASRTGNSSCVRRRWTTNGFSPSGRAQSAKQQSGSGSWESPIPEKWFCSPGSLNRRRNRAISWRPFLKHN